MLTETAFKGPDRRPSMSIGREGAICEQIEIMFKSSPVRATMEGLIKCTRILLQAGRRTKSWIQDARAR